MQPIRMTRGVRVGRIWNLIVGGHFRNVRLNQSVLMGLPIGLERNLLDLCFGHRGNRIGTRSFLCHRSNHPRGYPILTISHLLRILHFSAAERVISPFFIRDYNVYSEQTRYCRKDLIHSNTIPRSGDALRLIGIKELERPPFAAYCLRWEVTAFRRFNPSLHLCEIRFRRIQPFADAKVFESVGNRFQLLIPEPTRPQLKAQERLPR